LSVVLFSFDAPGALHQLGADHVQLHGAHPRPFARRKSFDSLGQVERSRATGKRYSCVREGARADDEVGGIDVAWTPVRGRRPGACARGGNKANA
jgi:hypothetical protein